MFYREIARTLGAYLYFLAGTLAVPFFLAVYFQFIANPEVHPQPHSTLAFGITIAFTLGLAFGLRHIGKRSTGALYRREGLALVAMIWFLTAFIGSVPFVLSGTLENPVDAYFESMSGLTTTGASCMAAKKYDSDGKEIPIVKSVPTFPPTQYVFYGTIAPVKEVKTGKVLTGVEAVGKALLFWRSFLQWIGGMGIVVLFLAILPALGVGGKVLYQAEVPGPVKDSLTPRIRETASMLWKFYIGLTALEIILLMTTNERMPFFDAMTIAFSNLSTGGFTIRNGSIGAYNNLSTELVVILFMILGSLNFGHYANILRGKFRRLRDPELLTFFAIIIVAVVVVSFSLIGTQEILLTPNPNESFSVAAAFRYGSFQLISLMTSTGFATADFNYWPFLCQVILLTSMYIGGMSGSTAGGIKIIRHNIAVRGFWAKLETIFRPQTVRKVVVGGIEVSNDRLITILTFIFLVIALTLIGTILLVADGVDPETALSINGCMLNNIGAAFRAAGPTESFAFLTPFGKIISIFWMVLGRLEFFALLIVFRPAFWRNK